MNQAITYMTYSFTVANTGQRKPFHQICICSKTMQQISLKGHRLVMVFMENMVLNPFTKYSGFCQEQTVQCNQPWYACRVQLFYQGDILWKVLLCFQPKKLRSCFKMPKTNCKVWPPFDMTHICMCMSYTGVLFWLENVPKINFVHLV